MCTVSRLIPSYAAMATALGSSEKMAVPMYVSNQGRGACIRVSEDVNVPGTCCGRVRLSGSRTPTPMLTSAKLTTSRERKYNEAEGRGQHAEKRYIAEFAEPHGKCHRAIGNYSDVGRLETYAAPLTPVGNFTQPRLRGVRDKRISVSPLCISFGMQNHGSRLILTSRSCRQRTYVRETHPTRPARRRFCV
jgi:hypothetical protein